MAACFAALFLGVSAISGCAAQPAWWPVAPESFHESGLLLIQRGAKAKSSESLTEDGYRQVAALNDDASMEAFVKRLLDSMDLTLVGDAASKLSGLIPYYSGTKSVQTLARLKEELSTATWTQSVKDLRLMQERIPASRRTGALAPLSEAGYQIVAGLHNDDEMMDFARRVLKRQGREVPPEAESELRGLSPYYSGVIDVQSLAHLEDELWSAKWPKQLPLKKHANMMTGFTQSTLIKKLGSSQQENSTGQSQKKSLNGEGLRAALARLAKSSVPQDMEQPEMEAVPERQPLQDDEHGTEEE